MRHRNKPDFTGTRTYYLPVNRYFNIPPEVTIVIRQMGNNGKTWYHAGVAVCSEDDQFTKKRGRHIAYYRMLSRPFFGDKVKVAADIHDHLANLHNRRGVPSRNALGDLMLGFFDSLCKAETEGKW